MESTGTLRLGFADHLRNVEVAFARASLFFLRTSDDRRLHICHDLGCDQNSVIATGGYVQWRIMFHISPCPFPLEINVDLDLPDVAVDDYIEEHEGEAQHVSCNVSMPYLLNNNPNFPTPLKTVQLHELQELLASANDWV